MKNIQHCCTKLLLPSCMLSNYVNTHIWNLECVNGHMWNLERMESVSNVIIMTQMQ